ncbi:MAG: hypothetical protein PWK00_10270, partial [Coxiella burnetii]|nr:hypothetical protein [Coxiella burnetii]
KGLKACVAGFQVEEGEKGTLSRSSIMRYISEAGKSMVYPGEGAGICCYQKEQTDCDIMELGRHR